jgi:glycosyltransferase involved in cell wall biosynthesis
MRANKKRILYCFAGNSVFGYRDIKMLQNEYSVAASHFDIMPSFLSKAWSYLKYNFDVISKIFFIDTVIVNFGSWHTILPVFLAKFLGKKSIIILGGFDAGNVPSIQYGVFHKPSMLQWFMRRTYTAATYLCPVSEALVSSINRYADPSGVGYKIGLLHHMPEVRSKVNIIATDYDDSFWKINESINKEGILALAYVYNSATYTLKGFDLLTECAFKMPGIKFTFVGFSPQMIEKYEFDLPENVKLISFVSDIEARNLYQSHKVFVLVSMTEGLPNTLCEAMLCGCVAVVSDVSVLPEVVNDFGYVLKEKKVETLGHLLNKALNLNNENYSGREKIIKMYPKGIRIQKLSNLVLQ